MPGKHFDALLSEQEIIALADTFARDIVQRMTQQCFRVREEAQHDGQELAVLHCAGHLREALQRLADTAAQDAASKGAGYPDLGRASGMTRQGARRRWPGILSH